jgi:hypothetical protein
VPCPDLASYTLAFALQLRKKHGKTSVRVAGECQLARWKQNIRNRAYITVRIHKHNNNIDKITTIWPLPSHGSPRHAPCLLHIHARGLRVGRYPPLPVLYSDCPRPVTALLLAQAIFEPNLFPYKYSNILKPSHSSYRGADTSLARPTSRCSLFDGENISFYASLLIYI